MGAQLEPQAPSAEPVTWIGRDPAPNILHPVDNGGVSRELGSSPAKRMKWVWAALVAAIAVAIVLSLRHVRSTGPTKGTPAANSIPVVSVTSPGSRAVTAQVSFTGALAARYDMPIGSDTDTGRVKEIYVEAGDRVRQGQILARLDESVLVPQVNRLAASLEESKAEAALSAAQYRRALGV